MRQPFRIEISAYGPQGCGKTQAIQALVNAIANNPDFVWIDGRFHEFGDGIEAQDIELRLGDGN